MDSKRCGSCKELFEGPDIGLNFSKRRLSKDGFYNRCKACSKSAISKIYQAKKSAKVCVHCAQPLLVGSNLHCFKHHVYSLYRSNHNGLSSGNQSAKRRAKVTVQMATQLEAKWVQQGGNPDGTGYAICPTSGHQISFEDGTASLGHINANLTGVEFADPSNICWESKQVNLSNRAFKHGEREESKRIFDHWSHGKPFSAPTIRQLWYAKDQVCPYTGYQLQYTYEAQLDHIIAKSQGGTDDLSNLQFVSAEANVNKGNLSHDEFVNKLIKQGRLKAYVEPNPLA